MKKNELQSGQGLLHVRVRNELEDVISQMEIGERLPPERQLSERFEVNRRTIRRAMLDLENEGCIVRHQGRGTFVNKSLALGVSPSSKSGTIGMSIPAFDRPGFQSMLRGVNEEALKKGFGVLVSNSIDPKRERENLRRLMTQHLDSLIVVPFARDSVDPEYVSLVQELHRQGTQIVFVDVCIPNVGISFVIPNREMMGYMSTQHLILLGHRKIAYATTGQYDTSGRDSLRGYRMALEDYGIDYDEKLVMETPLHLCPRSTHDAILERLKENPKNFTAIATDVYSMTCAIVNALKERELRVPEEIALVGADVEGGQPELARVTHTAVSFEDMGRQAVNLILDEENKKQVREIFLSPRLVIGNTCGFTKPTIAIPEKVNSETGQ